MRGARCYHEWVEREETLGDQRYEPSVTPELPRYGAPVTLYCACCGAQKTVTS